MDITADSAAEKLAWMIESISAIELEVEDRIESHVSQPGREQAFDRIQGRYIATDRDQRLFDQTGLMGRTPVWHSIGYADGSRCAELRYDRKNLERQNFVAIRRQFWNEGNHDRRNEPLPILFLHVGREPLHQALTHAEPLGPGRAGDLECPRFLFRQVRWAIPQDHVYFLDPETAYPVRVESYASETDRQENRPQWVWSADEFRDFDGHALPRVSRMIMYNPDGSVLTETTSEIESAAFNRDYEASTFWPTLEPGVMVNDTIENTQYTFGAETLAATPPPSAIVQAVPPKPWTAHAATGATVAGGLLLVAALVVFVRSRLVPRS